MNTPAQCGVIKPPKTDIYSEAPYGPGACGVGCDAAVENLAVGDVDEEQQVEAAQ